MCIGDYNEIISMVKKSEGNMRQNSLMQDFRQTLEACKLVDLGYIGPKFTWSNCQEGTSLIRERLDRGCANHDWRVSFPEVEILKFMWIRLLTLTTPHYFCICARTSQQPDKSHGSVTKQVGGQRLDAKN
jgi:hypothetical protein